MGSPATPSFDSFVKSQKQQSSLPSFDAFVKQQTTPEKPSPSFDSFVQARGGQIPGITPPGAPPLPPDLGGPNESKYRNLRTGRVTTAPGDTRIPVIDAPITGGQHVIEGVEQMAQPEMREKAGGLHKVVSGAFEAATPGMVVAGAAAPVRTAITLGTTTISQSAVESGLKKLGLPEEYAAVAGDLAGLIAGVRTHEATDSLKKSVGSTLKDRYEQAGGMQPPPTKPSAAEETLKNAPPLTEEDRHDDPFSAFFRDEEGSFKSDFLKKSTEESRALLEKRKAMKDALEAKAPSQALKDAGQESLEYITGEKDALVVRANQEFDALKKFVPKPIEREALFLMRDFKNKPHELELWLNGDHSGITESENPAEARKRIEKARPAIELALNPTPGMLAADARLNDFAELSLLSGKKMGFLDSSLSHEEYVPHILRSKDEGEFDVSPTRFQNAAGRIARTFAFARARKAYPTVLDAIADGAKPRTMDALDAFTVYADKFATKYATVRWEQAVKEAGLGKWRTSAGENGIPDGWQPFARSTGIFKNTIPVIDKATGEPRVMNQQFFVPPVLNEIMRPVTDPNYMMLVPGFQKTNAYQQWQKGVNLSFSLFHPKALEMMALSNMKPGENWRAHMLDLGSEDAKYWERRGAIHGMKTSMLGRTIDAYNRLEPGSIPTVGDIVAKAPLIKQASHVAEATTRLTFDVLQRKMKIWNYAADVTAWIGEHPGHTPAELSRAETQIGRQVNSVYGNLNWETLGWNKTSLAIARLGLLAPDWFFSNVVNFGQAFEGGWKGNAGSQNARMFWVRAATSAITLSQLTSFALTGQWSDRPFQVYEGKDKQGRKIYRNLFSTGALGDMVNVIGKMKDDGIMHGAGEFLAAKTKPIIRSGLQLFTNETYAHKQITPKDMAFLPKSLRQMFYFGRELTPIPFSVSNSVDMMSNGEEQKWYDYFLTIMGGGVPSHVVPEGQRMTKHGLKPETHKKPDLDWWDQSVTGKTR